MHPSHKTVEILCRIGGSVRLPIALRQLLFVALASVALTLVVARPVSAQPPPITVNYSLFDPLECTGPGHLVTGTIQVTANVGGVVLAGTATLPAGLPAIPGSCTTTLPGTINCFIVNPATMTFGGPLASGQTVTINFQAEVGDLVPAETILCSNVSVAVVGGPVTALQACITVTCPTVGPGIPLTGPASQVNDQKPGSVLYYNFYTSGTTATTQNTRISITNVNPNFGVSVHLFFVDGNSCVMADRYLCLTPNQTMSFLTSEQDPGTSGYLIAVATNFIGCPINFNYLVGDLFVKLATGHQANLAAEAFGAKAGGRTFCNPNTVSAQLFFDGISYDRAPRVLALDNIADRASGNDTLLILNRVGGNLVSGVASIGSIFGILYDDAETPHSFQFSAGCHFRFTLTNTLPKTSPRLETVIPAGQSGWIRLFSPSDIGLLGSVINFNPNVAISAGAYNQGHNLHKLTLAAAPTLIIPVYQPNCADSRRGL